MNAEERLFHAIGEVDETLLERSQRPRKKRGALPLGLAACLLLAVAGYLFLRIPGSAVPPSSEPPSEAHSIPVPDTPAQSLRLSGSEVGTFHLHQLCYDGSREHPDFILYVDEEHYRQVMKNGVYTIEPLADMGKLPICSLEISHQPGITLADAARLAGETLADTYTAVSEPTEAGEDRRLVTASNGTAWDAAQAEVHLVDDRQGGVFILVSRYFTEATEGHGARFSDMIGTFEVVTPQETAPDWLTELRDAGERLIPAVFSGDLSDVADLLAENAMVDIPPWEDRSIAAIDYTTDSDQSPSRAVISVRHRQLEDSYDYLTIELTYSEGRW